MVKSIFISYSSRDKKIAEELQEQLEKRNYKVWRDVMRLKPGANWAGKIAEELVNNDIILLIWSKDSAQSQWVKNEWLTARALGKIIVPCCLPQAPELPQALYNINGVMLSDEDDVIPRILPLLEEAFLIKPNYDYSLTIGNLYLPKKSEDSFIYDYKNCVYLKDLYLNVIGSLNKMGVSHVGISGIHHGKSDLVIEFAYRFSFAFEAIYWIDGEKNLQDELIRLTNRLEPETKSDHQQLKECLYTLQRYFQVNRNILIIINNIKPELISQPIANTISLLELSCHLIFTSSYDFRICGVKQLLLSVVPHNKKAVEVSTEWRRTAAGLFAFVLLLIVSIFYLKPVKVTIGTSPSTVGGYTSVGAFIAKVIQQDTDILCNTLPTKGSVANAYGLCTQKLHLAFAQEDVVFSAYLGKGTWEGKPQKQLRAIFIVYIEKMAIVASTTNQISTFSDLSGKKVNIGNKGSGTRDTVTQIFKKHNNFWNNTTTFEWKGEKAIDLLIKQDLDAMFYMVGHPNEAIKSASNLHKIRLIPFPKLELPQPYFYTYLNTNQLYPQMSNKDQVETIGVNVIFATTSFVTGEVVYKIVKAFFDNVNLRNFTVKFRYDLLPTREMIQENQIPIHRGAKRYYYEQGWLKDKK